jgi:DNA-binding NtrC family response regulator
MVEGRRFLVVDDNREFARDLCELLALEGSQGAIAETAEQALLCIERESFQALFTDLRLPGQSGVDLIEELKRRGLSIPVVLMTACADDDVLRRAESAGAVDVLSKPIDIDRWLALARRFMRHRSSRPSTPPESETALANGTERQ